MSHPHVQVDGTWVDLLYPAADLKHSTGFYVEEKADGSPSPSGALRASVTLACPDDMQAHWLLPGKSFEIYSHAGGLIWSGLTTEPERGDGSVTLHAEGIGAKLKDWLALFMPASDELPTFVPNDAVDYAESIGAPFGRYGVDLGSTAIVPNTAGAMTDLLTLLTRAAILQGKRLYVDRFGAITYRDNPTTPTWMMTPQSDYFGTADDVFLSSLRGFYQDAETGAFWVKVVGSPTGGTFTLSGNGATAADIAYNASAATFETRIRSLGGVFGTAIVTLFATSSWLVDMPSGNAVMTADSTNLTGGTNPGVTIQEGVRPSIVKAEDTDAADKFGIKQGYIDLFALGAIPTSTAQDYIDGRFALVGARTGWTTQVQLSHANLFHAPTGLFADPRHVKAGDMLQIPGIIDARSNPTTRGSIQWVIQEVEVTEGPYPTATVTPVGFVPRDFDGLLAPPENPTTTEAA